MDPEEEKQYEGKPEQNKRLVKLYILGDQLQIIQLCNAVIDCIHNLYLAVRKFPGERALS